jgi:hypothetical protein
VVASGWQAAAGHGQPYSSRAHARVVLVCLRVPARFFALVEQLHRRRVQALSSIICTTELLGTGEYSIVVDTTLLRGFINRGNMYATKMIPESPSNDTARKVLELVDLVDSFSACTLAAGMNGAGVLVTRLFDRMQLVDPGFGCSVPEAHVVHVVSPVPA